MTECDMCNERNCFNLQKYQDYTGKGVTCCLCPNSTVEEPCEYCKHKFALTQGKQQRRKQHPGKTAKAKTVKAGNDGEKHELKDETINIHSKMPLTSSFADIMIQGIADKYQTKAPYRPLDIQRFIDYLKTTNAEKFTNEVEENIYCMFHDFLRFLIKGEI